MITITSKQRGFRRCGIAHPDQPTTYDDDKFTRDELAILQAEQMLTVVVSEGETEKGKKGKEAKAPATQDKKD